MKQKLLNSFRLKATLLVAVLCALFTGQAWADTSTLTFTSACNGSGTSDDGLAWTITSDGTESTFDSTSGIHYGTNKASVTYITLTTTNLSTILSGKKITKIIVNARDAQSNATITVSVGSTTFTANSSNPAIANTSADFRFDGEATIESSNQVTVDVRRSSSMQKAIYVKSIEITYEDASAPSYTITAQSNNTNYGTVSLSGSVITASPAEGYTYASTAYTVSSGSATVSQNGNDFTVTPSSDCTVTINFEALPTYTVTFSDGGSVTQDLGGASVTLPSRSAIGSYTFAGWSETNVPSETTTAPTIISAGSYTPTGDITLYPVYTKAGGGAATPSAFSVGDTGDFAIVSAEQGGKYYALPTSPTVSSGKITAQEITVSETGGVKYVTTANASGFTWTIAHATNGYTLYDGSKYIYHSNGGSSGTNLTYGESTSYTWAFTADGNFVTMAGMAGSTTNNRGMLFSGTTIGGYALSNVNNAGYYKIMILPISAGSTNYYWSSPVAAAVERPVITIAQNPFLFSTTATITCETTGATIYYTLDGNDPTTSSYVYSTAIPLTATTTIKAFAVLGSDESTIASATATKNLADPTVTINSSSITNTNVYTGTAAGSLSASVTYNDAEVAGATVTWSGNNDEVATINATTGVVTLVAAGSVTFTATYAGNSDYNGATATYNMTVTNQDPNAAGSENNPYTVAQAIAATPASGTSASVYIHGIVSAFYNTSIVGDGTNYRYYISDDGTTTDQLLVYKGKKNSTDNFSSADDLQIGDVVTIYGGLTTFSNAPEVASGNYIVSLFRKAENPITVNGGTSFNIDRNNNESSLTFSATAESGTTVTYAVDASNTTLASTDYSLSGSTLTITGTSAGTITITASAAGNSEYKDGEETITVTVLGVKSDATIVVNASETVAYGSTFTVDDSQIEGGDITVTSSNTAVATVDGLVITPAAVGTTTITVATAANDFYNAGSETFTLTVTAPAGKTTAYVPEATTTTLSFGGNAFSLPIASSSSNNSFSNGTYTIGISNASGYYYFDNEALLIGKSGATITLPAFDKDVTQIDVIGKTGASGKVTENIFVGETAVSTERTGSTTTNEFSIDPNYQNAGTIYKLKVTNGNNAQIKSIVVHFAATPLTATLNANGYATFCSEYPLDFTEAESNGYSAWQIKDINGENITFEKITGSVKGGTGLFLMGTANETVTLSSVNSSNTLDDNMLIGTLAPTYVTAGEVYGLSGNQFVPSNAAGTIKAGKAYLDAEDVPSNVRSFTFKFEDPATGITETRTATREEVEGIFNLAGQRMSKMQRGINIVNGKKVLMK